MKQSASTLGMIVALLFGLVFPAFAGSSSDGSYSPEMQAKIEEMKNELKKYTDEKATIGKNIETFDTLDFVVFSNQEWKRWMRVMRRMSS
jgi:hypothetical protein